ncbi:MAG: hypothetical protein ACREFU_11600, partial [Acetobacteraceae bacterium]
CEQRMAPLSASGGTMLGVRLVMQASLPRDNRDESKTMTDAEMSLKELSVKAAQRRDRRGASRQARIAAIDGDAGAGHEVGRA